MKNLRAYLLLGSALLLCPCHLPIVIGLLVAGGLGGGVLASFLSENMTWLIALTAIYFLFAAWMGLHLLSRAAANQAKASTPDACCAPTGSIPTQSTLGGER